jgi:hypothetical protein
VILEATCFLEMIQQFLVLIDVVSVRLTMRTEVKVSSYRYASLTLTSNANDASCFLILNASLPPGMMKTLFFKIQFGNRLSALCYERIVTSSAMTRLGRLTIQSKRTISAVLPDDGAVGIVPRKSFEVQGIF